MKRYIIALDQGTTSSRSILFDRQGKIRKMAQKEFPQIYPKPGWVEQDPMAILSSQLETLHEVLEEIDPEDVAAIGITNQRETTVVWNKHTGKPVYNAIVWQCRRTAEAMEALRKEGFDKVIREKTGLLPDAYFSAGKIRWILENVEGARASAEQGDLLFGTVDSWLIWNLTGGKVHGTDYTNASRTMLFDIHTLRWDEMLLKKFGIPEAMLPAVYPSGHRFGALSPAVCAREIPIAGAAGDQQAALFGQGCTVPGAVKNTYGTGCFLLMHTGQTPVESHRGLLTTMAASPEGAPCYALEGSVFVGGAAIQWLRDEMGLLQSAADSEAIALSVPDTDGVYLVPDFTGMGAPYWNPRARGTVVGLTRGCRREHLVRAALESIAFQTHDLIRAMEEDAGCKLSAIKVDGGASANDFLMQFQADIIGADISRPACVETTALGAARLAGLTVGFWKDGEPLSAEREDSTLFSPEITHQKREQLLKNWDRAVRCALFWAENE